MSFIEQEIIELHHLHILMSVKSAQKLESGQREEKINLKLDFLETFQEGLKAYRKRQWKKGLSKFKECQKAAPEDLVYQMYLERCENFITQSPPKNWNGVYEFQEK